MIEFNPLVSRTEHPFHAVQGRVARLTFTEVSPSAVSGQVIGKRGENDYSNHIEINVKLTQVQFLVQSTVAFAKINGNVTADYT